MDGGGSLLGGQSTGGGILESGVESGLGLGNGGVVVNVVVGDLGGLLGGQATGGGVVESGLEGGLGGGYILSVFQGKGGSGGQKSSKYLKNKTFIKPII